MFRVVAAKTNVALQGLAVVGQGGQDLPGLFCMGEAAVAGKAGGDHGFIVWNDCGLESRQDAVQGLKTQAAVAFRQVKLNEPCRQGLATTGVLTEPVAQFVAIFQVEARTAIADTEFAVYGDGSLWRLGETRAGEFLNTGADIFASFLVDMNGMARSMYRS